MDKLKAKYETLVKGGKDEDGEERSQAYFVIKAAQRREELQREVRDEQWRRPRLTSAAHRPAGR